MNQRNTDHRIAAGLLSALAGLCIFAAIAANNPLDPLYKAATWKKDMTRDFKVMDTNRDGKVDLAEWQAHTNPLHPEYAKHHAPPGARRISKQEMDAVWQATAGSDNLVTIDEYVAHSNPLHPQFERDHAKPGTVKN
jgi:hypothetical protein